MVAEDVAIEDVQLEENGDEELVCPFALNLLKEIREYQNMHGLKHDDFQRYRQYCTRRLHRLYKGLKFLHGGKKFSNKKISPELFVKDVRYMHIILMRAERAWAYAMDLKQFANTESRKQVHLISKLKKAVIYAGELHDNCVALKCDATTQLEAKAYHHYMTGMLLFEQSNWQNALLSFNAAQKIYNRLADAVEEGSLYRAKTDEMGPKVQYCLYNIQSMGIEKIQGGEGEEIFKELDHIIATKATKATHTVREIKWEGKCFTIADDEIKILMVQMEDNIQLAKECSSPEKRLELYEEILSSCRDITQLIKKSDKLDNGELTTDYFAYLRITNTVDRFLVMAQQVCDKLKGVVETRPGSKIARPEDLVRLYDIILQNYADLKDITSLDKDGEAYQLIDVNTLFYRTQRCFYIAECHLGQSNWLNAIVLYDKCNEHIAQSLAAAQAFKSSKQQAMCSELQLLSKQIYSQRCSAHASAFLQTQDTLEEETKEKSPTDKIKMLADSLEEFDLTRNANELPTIATLPPDFQTIPPKPTFFDISLNHIEFPNLDERVEKESSGLSSFTKWIWGR